MEIKSLGGTCLYTWTTTQYLKHAVIKSKSLQECYWENDTLLEWISLMEGIKLSKLFLDGVTHSEKKRVGHIDDEFFGFVGIFFFWRGVKIG